MSDDERSLRTDELLTLQKPADERVHRDELQGVPWLAPERFAAAS